MNCSDDDENDVLDEETNVGDDTDIDDVSKDGTDPVLLLTPCPWAATSHDSSSSKNEEDSTIP